MGYPVCGFCMTAWDMIYQRTRTGTPASQWVNYCKFGGCDPDVWDYISEGSGWPNKWKLKPNGRPDWSKLPDPPPADDRCFHKRADSGSNAPWRKYGAKLLKESQEASHRRRNIQDHEVIWDEDEDETEWQEEQGEVSGDAIEWD